MKIIHISHTFSTFLLHFSPFTKEEVELCVKSSYKCMTQLNTVGALYLMSASVILIYIFIILIRRVHFWESSSCPFWTMINRTFQSGTWRSCWKLPLLIALIKNFWPGRGFWGLCEQGRVSLGTDLVSRKDSWRLCGISGSLVWKLQLPPAVF